jgi:hypothetical protein
LLALTVLALGGQATASAADTEQAQLTGTSDSFFGYSVAVSGSTAIIGAWNDAGGNGAAYVYVQAGTSWSLQQKLTAGNGASGDQFGYAVAISGNTALVGAGGKSNGQGAAYVFTRSGTTWAQQAQLTSSDGAASDCFGCSVAVAGTSAFIGAPGKLGNTGAAYAFTNAGTTWSQSSEFGGQTSEGYFGFSVAISSDAATAVAGEFGANSSQGSAYVFGQSGGSWSQSAVVTASDGDAGDNFGYAVAASPGAILVGAYANGGKGAAYYFAGSGTSWVQQSKLVASDGASNDYFGYAVALSGTTAVIGAYEKSVTGGPGEAYVFTSSGSAWSQQVVLPPIGTYSGYAVAASGTTAVVGALADYSGVAGIYGQAATPPPSAPALGGGEVALLLGALILGAYVLLGSQPRGGGLVS